jgi:hypothetical protein
MNTYVHFSEDQIREGAFGLEDLKKVNPDKSEGEKESDVEDGTAKQDPEED